MVWMVALREHGYNGIRRKIGDIYPVGSSKDSVVLRVARLAREAKKSEMPGEKPAKEVKSEKVKIKKEVVQSVVMVDEPAVDEPAVDEPAAEETVRQQRRRYRRNDMVPEQ